MRLTKSEWWLTIVSLGNSVALPLLPDGIQAAMAVAHPHQAWRYMHIATWASTLGGLLGYALGAWAFDIMPVDADWADRAQQLYTRWDVWFVAIAGFSPFPYKVAALTSGAMSMELGAFVGVTLLTRYARYGLISWAARHAGRRAQVFMDRHYRGVMLGVILISLFATVALQWL